MKVQMKVRLRLFSLALILSYNFDLHFIHHYIKILYGLFENS